MNGSATLASIGSRFTAQFIDGIIAMALAIATYAIAKSFGLALEWLFVAWLVYLCFATRFRKAKASARSLPRSQSYMLAPANPARFGARSFETCRSLSSEYSIAHRL